MRGREAQWTYRLSPPEIAEIEAAVKEVRRYPRFLRNATAASRSAIAAASSASERGCTHRLRRVEQRRQNQ
jgi:hypothetical protein